MDDRARLSRILIWTGVVGMIGAFVVGVSGWLLAGRATRAVMATIVPAGDIVGNVSETIEASLVLVDNTTAAVASIESATRSTGRTLGSVADIIDQTAVLAGGSIADSLDSALATLPGLIDTSRLVDRTMRTLSLVGVEYSPDLPLDQALGELEQSLRPIPDELRSQVDLLETVQTDIETITTDAGDLAAILLATRLDMMEARSVLQAASDNAIRAEGSVAAIESEIGTYDSLARIAVVATALALMAAASTPLIIGIHYRSTLDDS